MIRPVVVGWSGSTVSDRAVEVGAGFAERSGALHVLVAWDFVNQPGTAFDPRLTPAKVQARPEAAVAPIREHHPMVKNVCDALLGWPPAFVCGKRPAKVNETACLPTFAAANST